LPGLKPSVTSTSSTSHFSAGRLGQVQGLEFEVHNPLLSSPRVPRLRADVIPFTVRKELARSFGATLVVLVTIVMTMTLIRTLGQASRGSVNPQEVMMVMGYTVLGYLPPILTLSPVHRHRRHAVAHVHATARW
jgi:hypothetical protein